MQKNKKQLNNVNTPAWFDGSNINEAAFCDEFLRIIHLCIQIICIDIR